jgi:hypothetical protein
VVEHNLAKVGVASSNLVSRSIQDRLQNACTLATRHRLAGWQSGYAAACKAVNAGSIPTLAFYLCTVVLSNFFSDVMALTGPDGGIGRRKGLKIPRVNNPCRFDSGSGYHYPSAHYFSLEHHLVFTFNRLASLGCGKAAVFVLLKSCYLFKPAPPPGEGVSGAVVVAHSSL